MPELMSLVGKIKPTVLGFGIRVIVGVIIWGEIWETSKKQRKMEKVLK